jgi:hypothetical protein
MKMGDPSQHNLAMVDVAEVFAARIFAVARTFQIFQNQNIILVPMY